MATTKKTKAKEKPQPAADSVQEPVADATDQVSEDAQLVQKESGSYSPDVFHPHQDYCDVYGESLSTCQCTMPDEACIKKVYLLENLGSENSASRMEKKIKGLPGVKYASITFTTKQLRISADDPDALLPQIQAICSSVESGVKVVEREKSPGSTITKTYILENLDSTNTAVKIEQGVNKLPGIQSAKLSFPNKQLRVSAKNPDAHLQEIQVLCTQIEAAIIVVPKDESPKSEDILNMDTILPEARQVKPSFHLTDDMKSLLYIVCAAILLAVGASFKNGGQIVVGNTILVIAYVIVGMRVFIAAVRNVLKQNFLEANFMVTISSLCAFALNNAAAAVGIMVCYRIAEFVEHFVVKHTREKILENADLRSENVNLMIGEDVQKIPAEQANVGDIILVRPGERVPLDGVVINGESRLDLSPLTGDSTPVSVSYGDEILSGSLNTTGPLRIRVEKVLKESMVTKLLDEVEGSAASKPKFQESIEKFTKIFTPVMVLIAICIAILPSIATGHWAYYFRAGLTFLIISCPCSLLLSVPLAYFSAIGQGLKNGVLFKSEEAIESLGKIKAVVMDKTGTVTKGSLSIQDIVPADEEISADQLLIYAAESEMAASDPIAEGILKAAEEKGLSVERPSEAEKIDGCGVRAVLPDGVILCGNSKLMDKYSVSVPEDPKTGYDTEVFVAKDGMFIGYLTVTDPIKEDAKAAVSRMKDAGLTTVMLTGDSESSAQAAAAVAGIDEYHAGLLAQDKMSELINVKNANGTVMYVGDAVNNAQILAGAEVSAAMGDGADASLGTTDVVYMSSSMDAVPQSVSIAKQAHSIAWQNVILSMALKVIVMVLALVGGASLWLAAIAEAAATILCVLNGVRSLYWKK